MSLFSAIDSGDTSSAQSAYDAVTSLLGPSDDSSSLLSDRSSNTASSSLSASSFETLLSSIGTALDSGNVNSAQNAIESFLYSTASPEALLSSSI
jgi:hypothetical protein